MVRRERRSAHRTRGTVRSIPFWSTTSAVARPSGPVVNFTFSVGPLPPTPNSPPACGTSGRAGRPVCVANRLAVLDARS